MKSSKKRQKHVPQRTCVVCRRKMDKRSLLRIVRSLDNGTVADPTGKRNGRGTYLCSQSTCWDQALTGNVLDKTLQVEISEAEKEKLAKYRPLPEKNDSE
jgi:predicted RNA-binding protein YlxR (DUF448 family)